MILRLIILRKSKKTVLVGGNVRKNPCIYGVSVLDLSGGLISDYHKYITITLFLSARTARTRRAATHIPHQTNHVMSSQLREHMYFVT